jgi:catechol-2,3-dioxygenase
VAPSGIFSSTPGATSCSHSWSRAEFQEFPRNTTLESIGLGVPAAFYHFAFEAGSEAGLEAKRQELAAKGVEVTDIVDHNWAKSIYFSDPNGISLEFCCLVREFVADDANMQERFEIPIKALGLNQNDVGEVTKAQSHSYKAKSS